MKDITLGKFGQVSLIAYISTWIVPLTMGVLQWANPGLNLVYMNVAAVILIFLYAVILCLGIKELDRSKFPLFWLVPCFVSAVFGIGSLLWQPSTNIVYSENDYGELIPAMFSAEVSQKENGDFSVDSLYYPLPAESSKIQPDDVILKIDGEYLERISDSPLKERLDLTKVREVTIVRNGEEYQIVLP